MWWNWCSKSLCFLMNVGNLAVLFNLYGPRAECDDIERIRFKLTFFKILQVTQIVPLSTGLTVNGFWILFLHSCMKKHALDFYFLWLHYWRGEYWCLIVKLISSIYHSQTSSSISLFWGEKEAKKKRKESFVLQRQEEHKFVYGPIH